MKAGSRLQLQPSPQDGSFVGSYLNIEKKEKKENAS
jgi:hypothetical protein